MLFPKNKRQSFEWYIDPAQMPDKYMLSVEGLSVHYGKAQALEDVSLTVERGEFLALIGPNGAGKTTLLNTIAGLLKPSAGEIRFRGTRTDLLPAFEVVKLRMSLCPENRHLAPEMTVLENLELGAYLRKDKPEIARDLEWVFTLFPRLKERHKQLAGTLSGGEQQMLAIGRSLMSRPLLLMLDEPSLGLAPLMKERIFEKIAEIRESGVTVLLVEQDASLALNLADRAYVMENGRVILEGYGKFLLENPYVVETYLGI